MLSRKKCTVTRQSVGTACDNYRMTHPGENWLRITPRSPRDVPCLVLNGRRCIPCDWPPTAVCETCKKDGVSGYAGPTSNDLIAYPNPSIRYVCTNCARSHLGLEPGELSGHSCVRECAEPVHTDAFHTPRSHHSGRSDGEIVALYAPEYASRGWRVLSVIPATWLAVTTGDRWAVQFVPSRNLW